MHKKVIKGKSRIKKYVVRNGMGSELTFQKNGIGDERKFRNGKIFDEPLVLVVQ